MNDKTKFFIAILLTVFILLLGTLKISASTNTDYSGTGSVSGRCDRKGDDGDCYYHLTVSNSEDQAWQARITAHLEGHGKFGNAGGRGSVYGCLSATGTANTGSCWWWLENTQVGDGNFDINNYKKKLSDFANYDLAYSKLWVRAFANDATWDPFTVSVDGRHVNITAPTNDINTTTGASFTVNWNVEYGENTVFEYDENVMTCNTGSGYEPVGNSGSTECTAKGTPGAGEIIVASGGPSASGKILIQKTIIVAVASGQPICVSNENASCTSPANSCGQKNTGKVKCDGSCDASAPDESTCGAPCAANQGASCTSLANSCSETNTGTIQCDGSCNAVTPNDSTCPLSPSSNLILDCPLPGTTVNVSWTPPPFWNTFYLRANPGANNGTWPSAVIQDTVVGPSSSFSSIPGQTYHVWVHTRSPANGAWSTEITGNVLCKSSGMYGSLAAVPTSCLISAGQGACPVNLSWHVFGPEIPDGSTVDNSSGDRVGAGDVRNDFSVQVNHGGEIFTLKNNNKELAKSPVGADCTPGMSWNGTVCVPDRFAPMTGYIAPHSPSCIIATGNDRCPVSLSWDIVNPQGISAITSSTNDDGTAESTYSPIGNSGGPKDFNVHYGNRIFFLYNNTQLLDSTIATSNCNLAAGDFWSDTQQKCMAGGTTCPPGSTGTYPNCVGPSGGGSCPPGFTGTYPNCVGSPGGGSCPPGFTGTYPNCVDVPRCHDHAANNFNGPLPCAYNPSIFCHDPDANNIGALLPCTYPIGQKCMDPEANNFNDPNRLLPCTYDIGKICPDTDAVNSGDPRPCAYTDAGLCPASAVTLSAYSAYVGQSVTAKQGDIYGAPPGFSPGIFVSSNPGVASVSGNVVTAKTPGSAVIYGTGWTYTNGLTCSIGDTTGSTCSAGLNGASPNCFGVWGAVLTSKKQPIFIEN